MYNLYVNLYVKCINIEIFRNYALCMLYIHVMTFTIGSFYIT